MPSLLEYLSYIFATGNLLAGELAARQHNTQNNPQTQT